MSAHRSLRAAFVGGSIQSAVGYAHYAAARLDGRFHIEAGCFSRNPAINRASADAYNVASDRVYPDWRLLLEAEAQRLDAIIVLTPTPQHEEIVAACLEAGIGVICEKALAANPDGALRLRDLQTQSDGFLTVTYNYSGYPIVRELRRLVASGALGRILHIQAEMPQEGFVRRVGEAPAFSPQAWRLEDDGIPTLYLDLGVHLHQLIYYLTGLKPQRVSATHGSFGCFEDVIDHANALAYYEGDVPVQLWFSKAALGARNGLCLRLYGDNAAAEWRQENPETLWFSHADGRREVIDRGGDAPSAQEGRYARFKPGHPAGYIEAFANLYTDIAEALCAHKDGARVSHREIFGAELALEGLYFMDAIRAAAQSREWRDVPGQILARSRACAAA